MSVRLLWLGLCFAPLLGCQSQGVQERELKGETITVGCGSCMFHMPEAQGCPFAAEIDGKHYLIQGRVPEDHNRHAHDGICVTTRKAVVDGVIRDGKLITSRLDLKPADDLSNSASAPLDHSHE